MSLAGWLMRRATGLMPPERRAWAEAMKAEFGAVTNRERLGFAAGCLWAAVRARLAAVSTWVAFGRCGVGLVTAIYAAFHLFGMAWVTGILLGGQDSYHDLLVAHGHVQAAARLHESRPWLALYLAGMGIGNMMAAVFLVWWRPNLFMAGWAMVALTVAVATVGGIMTSGIGTGTLWGWQFVPLVMLAGAAAALAWAADRRRRA